MDDDRMLLQMMEAAIIAEGLKLFIGQLKASPHQDTDEYKSLLAFASRLQWKYYQQQTAHKVEFDIFGKLRIKRDDRMNYN